MLRVELVYIKRKIKLTPQTEYAVLTARLVPHMKNAGNHSTNSFLTTTPAFPHDGGVFNVPITVDTIWGVAVGKRENYAQLQIWG